MPCLIEQIEDLMKQKKNYPLLTTEKSKLI